MKKMKKKLLAVTTATVMSASLLLVSGITAKAEEVNGSEVTESDEAGIAVQADSVAVADANGFVIEDGVLIEYTGTATVVVIPDSVTKIGAYSFEGNTSLSEVTIPNGVTEIGIGAFLGCTSLTEVVIPSSLVATRQAFVDCTNLRKVTIMEGVKDLGDGTFSGCTSLSEIAIPASVESIGFYTFSGCTSLSKVTIPNSVTSLYEGAFLGCTSLSEVTIPSSVTYIEETVFEGCEKLTIYGEAGSYAETFAKENNISFIAISTTDVTIDKENTNSTFVKGSSAGATIKCSGALAEFMNVYVDGTLIDKSNYTLKEGSTIITFTQAFMDTLSAGNHVFTLEYMGNRRIDVSMTVANSAEASAPTTAVAKDNTPTTGDASMPWAYGVLAVSALGVLLVLKRKTA